MNLLSLNTYTPISLSELGKADLMDRVDRKYYFTIGNLNAILEEMLPFYRILEVEKCRLNTYKTLYFDTQDFHCFFQHHRGNGHRYKIRHRTYLESNVGFWEVKVKNNRGRTNKERIPFLNPEKDESVLDFLSLKTPYSPTQLLPTIWVEYQRITLVGIQHQERITLDLNLSFTKDQEKEQFPQLVIAEVKQDRHLPSPFVKAMQKRHFRPGGISKYCFGMVTLFPTIKSNHFKCKVNQLKKAAYGVTANS